MHLSCVFNTGALLATLTWTKIEVDKDVPTAREFASICGYGDEVITELYARQHTACCLLTQDFYFQHIQLFYC